MKTSAVTRCNVFAAATLQHPESLPVKNGPICGIRRSIFAAIRTFERAGNKQRQSRKDFSEIRNFLFLQLESPLGSVVHATPVFEALRHVAPEAHIVVAVSAMAQDVLALNPYIDRCTLVPSPFENFARARGVVREIVSSMPEGPCCIVTTVGNQRTRVALLSAFTGKCLRAGYTLAPELYDVSLAFNPERGQIEANLDILRALGHELSFCEPKVFFSEEEAEYAAGLLPSLSGLARSRIAFVTQNSGGQANRWSEERFQQAITQLIQTRDACPIFVGTACDAEAIDVLRRRLPNSGVSAAGKTSVRQLAALLAQCDLVVSLDTGTFHVARAVGLPGVVIAPAWQSAREWLPAGNPRYRVLQGPRIARPTADYCIQEVGVDAVVQAASELLERCPPSNDSRMARVENSLPRSHSSQRTASNPLRKNRALGTPV